MFSVNVSVSDSCCQEQLTRVSVYLLLYRNEDKGSIGCDLSGGQFSK